MTGRILVTGAHGFIGKHLVSALETRGYPVQPHTRANGDLVDCPLEYNDISQVFHLAGKTFVPDSWTYPAGFYSTNVAGTANVLEFCCRSRASLTFVSSYVYGTPRVLPISEEHPLQAFNPYSHSKILAEDVCRFYAERHAIPVTLIRPFNIYGPGQDERFLIPSLIRQALAPESSTIEVADSRPRRDYLYISDLVELLLDTLVHRCPGIYNAGHGVSTSIQELGAHLNNIVPCNKPLVDRGSSRPQEVLDVVADIRKAERDFRWKPRIDIATGLRLTVQAARGAGSVTLSGSQK